jgi:uncharacterized protein (TIGR02001 family)
MTWTILKPLRLAAIAFLGTALFAGPALADGMPKRVRAKAPEAAAPAPRLCALSANAALASEYVFRGFSQTAEGPAVQGGFDLTCGWFYAGVWASSLDFAGGQGATFDVLGFPFDASLETDLYVGIKPKTGISGSSTMPTRTPSRRGWT